MAYFNYRTQVNSDENYAVDLYTNRTIADTKCCYLIAVASVI